jgi:hypothetical protein
VRWGVGSSRAADPKRPGAAAAEQQRSRNRAASVDGSYRDPRKGSVQSQRWVVGVQGRGLAVVVGRSS